MTSKTAYVITQGEYSYYHVCAVFTSRENAEAALHAYSYAEIEEFPLDPIFPGIPPGFSAYRVNRDAPLAPLRCSEVCELGSLPQEVERINDWGYLMVGVVARDEAHAIKIASERFAQYDAQQAGIA